MKDSYLFEYVNENEFRMYESALRKYDLFAFKKLFFSYYPSFKEGEFLGKIISTNDQNNSKNYELILCMTHDDMEFIKLHYTVYFNEKIIMLDKITPEVFWRRTSI